MAIPSEADFTETLQACAQALPDDLIQSFSRDLLRSRKPSVRAAELIGACLDVQAARYRQIRDMTASLWLESDRFGQRAFYTAHRPTGSYISVEAARTRAYSLLHRRARQIPEDEYETPEAVWDMAHEAMEFHAPIWTTWLICTLPALYEYFYRPDTVAKALAHQRSLTKLEATATAGLRALREIRLMQAPRSGRIRAEIERSADTQYEMEMNRLGRAVSSARVSALPVKKLDRTHRERLLVFRWWQAHKARTGRASPTAIKQLLLVEGIAHQIDDRSIDAMFQRFGEHRGHRRKLRDLIDEIRGYNYQQDLFHRAWEKRRGERPPEKGPRLP